VTCGIARCGPRFFKHEFCHCCKPDELLRFLDLDLGRFRVLIRVDRHIDLLNPINTGEDAR
jgi:hypothetical protein